MTNVTLPPAAPIRTFDGYEANDACRRLLGTLEDIVHHYGGADSPALDDLNEAEVVELATELVATVRRSADDAEKHATAWRWRAEHGWLRRDDGILLDVTRRVSTLELAAAAAMASVELHRQEREAQEPDQEPDQEPAVVACVEPGMEITIEAGNLVELPGPDNPPTDAEAVVLITGQCLGCNLVIESDNTGRNW